MVFVVEMHMHKLVKSVVMRRGSIDAVLCILFIIREFIANIAKDCIYYTKC